MRHPVQNKIAPSGTRTVEVRLPDDRIERRSSKTMTYKWAIVRYDNNGRHGEIKMEWCVLGWSQSDKAAAATARKWSNYGNGGAGLIAAREV